jgi:hypothetical protein
MLSLNISDLSQLTATEAAVLRAIADVYHPQSASTVVEVCSTGPGQYAAHVKGMITPSTTLHPDDNPATGAPDQHALADRVFSGGAILTSGNAATAQLAEIGAKITEGIAALGSARVVGNATGGTHVFIDVDTTTPDPAQVFSGGGLIASGLTITAGVVADILGTNAEQPAPNVHAVTPIPPPSPPATPQTSLQPSPDATSASPPPPPPPVPAQDNASGVAPTTSGVQVDKSGLLWDARIHASTKTMTAKGMWTRRRSVTDDVVAQVEAQLRAAAAIPVPAATNAVWPFLTGSAEAPQPSAPTFPTLMEFITARITDKRLTQEQVTAAVKAVGLESLNLVMARVDLVPAILDELRKVAP